MGGGDVSSEFLSLNYSETFSRLLDKCYIQLFCIFKIFTILLLHWNSVNIPDKEMSEICYFIKNTKTILHTILNQN